MKSTGNINVPAKEFEPKNVKVRISIMIDQDVLEAIPGDCNITINETLRKAFLPHAT